MILAGIVTYNPDINKLKQCFLSICRQVDAVLIVDNASYNIDKIKDLIKNFTIKKQVIVNNKNLGIAKALNQILNYASDNNFEWFLTLDQDSICNKKMIEIYKQYCLSDVAQISCIIKDRNRGVINGKAFGEIDYCITSGALNNTLKLKSVGGYDNEFFIDGVDIDVSLKLKKNGNRIIKVNYLGLLHEIGSGKRVINGKLF